jgi:pantoate--beta-alanine ligase
MQIIRDVETLRETLDSFRRQGERIGFVPTMGNLHPGHLQLVRTAQQHSQRSVVSLFVNPTQFGANEDLDAYPRTFEADVQHLTKLGTDVLFAPTVDTIYPLGGNRTTRVVVPELTGDLCGASRPGHFDGVTTVVCKLFNMVQPDVAVFGEKDFQQLAVIRRMVTDLNIPIEIIGEPIVRESDGLAMSSRNGYLSKDQRQLATAIYRNLLAMKASIQANENLEMVVRQTETDLIAAGFRPDYIEVRRRDDLCKPQSTDRDLVILIAAFLGTTRLIDNITVQRH